MSILQFSTFVFAKGRQKPNKLNSLTTEQCVLSALFAHLTPFGHYALAGGSMAFCIIAIYKSENFAKKCIKLLSLLIAVSNKLCVIAAEKHDMTT